ncbi:hybrid sensory histidine kinase BarA [Duganella phyllosphaerae]|uniref:Hybrid sensory histidine kinase BarA n=1 Tax=Duganella phyllosphaerae TaxID=762836 RepID=A0A1E7WD88_9BURK|nr:hybrid sensory histidine kinase BarA [Duganella phyllosphaerae]
MALTADVMAADRARYLAAGFDDCLAKPIDRAAFSRVVAQHLPKPALAGHFSNLPGFAALVRTFRNGIAERVSKIAAALAHDDLAAAIHEAHSIKGSAATFGCPETGERAQVLEAACRGGDRAGAAAALAALEQASIREAAGP